mmetsp:Transcript_11818/g.13000  ORF Transcript_11818/g.13000 Transcript_11818/m.13000 type:complete len:403 (+) Transcript_11818:127-1335(+)
MATEVEQCGAEMLIALQSGTKFCVPTVDQPTHGGYGNREVRKHGGKRSKRTRSCTKYNTKKTVLESKALSQAAIEPPKYPFGTTTKSDPFVLHQLVNTSEALTSYMTSLMRQLRQTYSGGLIPVEDERLTQLCSHYAQLLAVVQMQIQITNELGVGNHAISQKTNHAIHVLKDFYILCRDEMNAGPQNQNAVLAIAYEINNLMTNVGSANPNTNVNAPSSHSNIPNTSKSNNISSVSLPSIGQIVEQPTNNNHIQDHGGRLPSVRKFYDAQLEIEQAKRNASHFWTRQELLQVPTKILFQILRTRGETPIYTNRDVLMTRIIQTNASYAQQVNIQATWQQHQQQPQQQPQPQIHQAYIPSPHQHQQQRPRSQSYDKSMSYGPRGGWSGLPVQQQQPQCIHID